MSGFTVYLIVYYSKYYEGNFYINYSLQGFSDSLSMLYITFISRLFSKKTLLVSTLRLLVIAMICFTGIHIFISQSSLFENSPQIKTILVPILILIIKLQVASIQNFGYHVNQQLFPILIRGRAMGITNFVSRPFAGLATVVTEYT